VNCPSCGSAADSTAKFCSECGARMASGCPSCGASNGPGARFCSECGAALDTPAQGRSHPGGPDESGAVVAERRVVSVLFADLVGFTPFAADRDAEEVRETLSRYFELASDVIARYGGTVEKFIGDAVMAVWGAPTAHEDDAERAVRAGLELVEAVQALGPTIQARAGILTGEAAITVGALNQGMVAGDLVNTASRLQSVAPPGSVLVGEATYRAASSAIFFSELGEQELKGKSAPIPAWQAIRVVAEVGGRNRSEGLEAPFVGRADELRLLKDLYHATGRERRARLVSIMGPAGIGKSRLAWEFSKYTDGVVETVYWHSGRSPAYGEGVTFWALGEMVRERCGLLESDDEETTRTNVAAAVSEWIRDPEERGWIERALLTLLGVEAEASAEQLFGAWRTFFERIAEHGTVALVFEDIHLADTGLLDFIEHLLEWSRSVPIFIVTLARPELLERRPSWGAGKRNFASLYLEPMSGEHMRELLGALVPGLPASTLETIVERADGIPLYAVETVRMLVAGGRLVERDGVYAPSGDLSKLAVPETLTALIASRLDGLDTSDRQLLHDAAVLGQSFAPLALAAVSGLSGDELDARLASLVRRELLRAQLDPRSPERGQYAFVQALIREVAYNTLARRDRKTRHLAAARYFEQLGSEELAGALAGHYLAAHANAGEGAEADALAAQARVALRAAADRAAALGAHEQAISFVEQALTVTPDAAEQADLLERAGRAANALSRSSQAEEFFSRVIELRRAIDDRSGVARAISVLGWALCDAQHFARATELLEGAVAEFADLWPDPVMVELKGSVLARSLVGIGQPERAVAAADDALAVAEHGDMIPVLAWSLLAKGAAYGSLGRLREGIALIGAAEELARSHVLNDVLTSALLVRGFHLGEIDQAAALEAYREGLAIARRLGNRPRARLLINNIGYTAFIAGDWDFALAELEGMLQEDLEPGERRFLTGNALNIRVCRGEDIAASLADLEALPAAEEDAYARLPALEVRALRALARGDSDECREYFRVAAEIDLAQAASCYYDAALAALIARDLEGARAELGSLDATGVHGRIAELRRQTVRAGIAALEGRTDDASAMFRDALREWRDGNMIWEEAKAGLAAVTVLDPASREAQAMAQSTRAILAGLGAKPFMAMLDGVEGWQPAPSHGAPSEAVPG
jgi:class 3 adenylate cyclase/tetratricopeptide (TPR) repeat protein